MPKKSAKKSTRKISASVKRLSSKRKASKISKKIVFVFLSCAVILLAGVITLKATEIGHPCANSISCIKDMSGTYEKGETAGVFEGKTVRVPAENTFAYVQTASDVLGESTGPKKITVDLSAQHLYAYEGDKVIMDFPVSTGKWNHTPTGTYNIWVKLRFTRMTGGTGADYYNLPNVPYVMFFYGDNASKGQGYSIHGTYWHNNFGHPMSHGCVNMKIADAGTLFAWADPADIGWNNRTTDAGQGTQVIIYGTTPSE